ncbi:hydrogenase maturation protease [Chloroflexota bacterium]
MKALVIGLGNPILQDDGIGIYAARTIRELLPPDHTIDVVELAVGGLGLMEAMIGYESVVLIDAIWSPEEADLGQVVQFTAADLQLTMNTASAHDVDLTTALQVGRQLGAVLPQDEAIHIVAVRARQVLDFGDRPTPIVLAALPVVVRSVMTQLGQPDPALALEELIPIIGGYDDFT